MRVTIIAGTYGAAARRACVILLALSACGMAAPCGRGTVDVAARASAADTDVIVFAAASLKTALDDLVPTLERAAAGRVRVSYGATSALARQIEAGAPAAIFISADREWMDYLAARQLIRTDSRSDLLGNRLVLVAPRDRPVTIVIEPGFHLRAALGTGRLAVADPSAVPAGKYARAALTSMRAWDAVADRLAPTENVRAALLLVARGEAPLGIVYETDARAEPAVATVGVFPASSHPPVIYPVALTTSMSTPGARRVLDALCSPAAGAVFTRHGFRFRP